jgi:hypothetical protein
MEKKLSLEDWTKFYDLVKRIESESEIYKKSCTGRDVTDDVSNGFKLLYDFLDDSLTKAGKKPVVAAQVTQGFLDY